MRLGVLVLLLFAVSSTFSVGVAEGNGSGDDIIEENAVGGDVKEDSQRETNGKPRIIPVTDTFSLHDALQAAKADIVAVSAPEYGSTAAPPFSRPGPFRRFAKAYSKLLETHYLLLSFAQATLLGIFGDALAQAIEYMTGRRHVGKDLERKGFLGLDLGRMLDVGLLTMIIDGVFTPRWYQMLEFLSKKKTMGVVILKTVLCSIIYGPFANGFFLGGVPVLRYGWRWVMKGKFDWSLWRRQLLIATIRDIQMIMPLEFANQLYVPHKYQPLGYQASEIVFHVALSLIAFNDMELPAKWFFRAIDRVFKTRMLPTLSEAARAEL